MIHLVTPITKNLKGEKMINKVGSLGQRFVNASMNLEGTANERLAKMMQNGAKIFKDEANMSARVESLVASKQPMTIPAKAAAEAIVPENSINFLA